MKIITSNADQTDERAIAFWLKERHLSPEVLAMNAAQLEEVCECVREHRSLERATRDRISDLKCE